MRKPERQQGFSSLEFAVVIAVFCVFAGVLLQRLLYYEAYTERVYFDLTVRQMQNALRMRVANLMIEKKPVDYLGIAKENPMDWLEKKPAGYVEVLDGNNAEDVGNGEWFFDKIQREVLYRPQLDGEFGALLDKRGLVRIGLFFRYTMNGSANGLDLRVEAPGQKG